MQWAKWGLVLLMSLYDTHLYFTWNIPKHLYSLTVNEFVSGTATWADRDGSFWE